MENVHLGPADPYRVRLMLIVSTKSRLYQQRVLMARERRMATHLGRGQGKLGPAPSSAWPRPLKPRPRTTWSPTGGVCVSPNALPGWREAAERALAERLGAPLVQDEARRLNHGGWRGGLP